MNPWAIWLCAIFTPPVAILAAVAWAIFTAAMKPSPRDNTRKGTKGDQLIKRGKIQYGKSHA